MFDRTLNIFKAIGEETRLRIAVLLSRGELTVTELTQILGQSQPRVSRHLKIMADAGLVERFREGAWMFYRLAGRTADGDAAHQAIHAAFEALAGAGDGVLARDSERLVQSRKLRAQQAAQYFENNAENWDEVRRLHLPDSDIEAEMREMVGPQKVDLFLDLGTGTGRMLEVFADLYREGIGYDVSREMLAFARTKLEAANVPHAQVRHGDLFTLPVGAQSADLICIHQVLHFLTEPGKAIGEAAGLLRPGGRLLISDFAPHDHEFLREIHAHRRLGFDDAEMREWCARARLDLIRTKTLTPTSGNVEQSLTVKIWLCALPADMPVKTRPRISSKIQVPVSERDSTKEVNDA